MLLGFDQLNRLNEHGLIIADYNSYNTFNVIGENSERVGEFELYHQGISWDWSIMQQDVKEKAVKLHGVAMTVSGKELSQVVEPEPMQEYTEELKAYLRRSFGLQMEKTKCTDKKIT